MTKTLALAVGSSQCAVVCLCGHWVGGASSLIPHGLCMFSSVWILSKLVKMLK